MTAVETETEESTELAALSADGKNIVPEALVTSALSQRNGVSISDSYVSYDDAEIGEAVSVPLKKVEPATNLPLRIRVRKVLSNNIARRTLQVAIGALIVTVIYNGINLIPAFEGVAATQAGLHIQGKSEQNGRQSVIQAFIAECRGRKVCEV